MRPGTSRSLRLLLVCIASVLSTNAASDNMLNGSSTSQRSLKEKDTTTPTSAPTSGPTLTPTRMPKNDEKDNTDKGGEQEEVVVVPAAPVWTPTRMPMFTAAIPTSTAVRTPVSTPTTPTATIMSAVQAPTAPVPTALAPTAPVPVFSPPVPSPTPDPTITPTIAPTSRPTGGPTGVPTGVPTRGPTRFPTPEPTAVPTVTPTLAPTEQPSSKPSKRPSRSPSVRPTSRPSARPSSVPSSMPTLTRHEVKLNEFNVLLTSDQGMVNIAELETSLEKYILEGMMFDNLLRVKLDVVEGDSVTDQLGTLISTSVRFAGTATFTSFLPPSDEIRKEQGFVLDAKDLLQTELHTNPILAHATVREVSFNRIESTRPFDELEDENNKQSPKGFIAFVSAIGVVTILAVLGGILVVRLRKVEKRFTNSKSQKKVLSDDHDHSLDPPTKNRSSKDVGHGCASLVSGQVSLGVDSRHNRLPDSLDDIVIRPMFSDDEDDDAYLTMDEELNDPYEM